MLRNSILAVAILLLILAIGASIVQPAARPPTLFLLLIAAAIAFENRRYRHRACHDVDGMEPSPERFVDPETGKTMRVWIGPGGKRSYIEEQ